MSFISKLFSNKNEQPLAAAINFVGDDTHFPTINLDDEENQTIINSVRLINIIHKKQEDLKKDTDIYKDFYNKYYQSSNELVDYVKDYVKERKDLDEREVVMAEENIKIRKQALNFLKKSNNKELSEEEREMNKKKALGLLEGKKKKENLYKKKKRIKHKKIKINQYKIHRT